MTEFINHAVVQGDTVQAIAQRYLNDADKWIEIVELNDLVHPFIVDNFRDASTPKNVKAIGEIIFVPILDESEVLENLKPYQIKQGIENILGEDIALFDFGDTINFSDGSGEVRGDSQGDILTVKGIQNFKQALLIRFSIPMGSLYHHPNFGTKMYEYLGKKDSYENLQRLKIEIERTARDDSRVRNVKITKFELDNRGMLIVDLSIEAIGIEEVINMGLKLDEGGIIAWD